MIVRYLMTVFVLATGLVLLPGAVVATAGGGGGGLCSGFGEGATIVMRDSCFEGTGHVVPEGRSSITVTNEGQAPHTITAADDSFDSGIIEPGQSFELTLGGSDPVPIYCTLHGTAEGAGMAGLLVMAPSTATDDAELAASTIDGAPTAAWLVALLVASSGAAYLGRRSARIAATAQDER